jgi:hypothetical protein
MNKVSTWLARLRFRPARPLYQWPDGFQRMLWMWMGV